MELIALTVPDVIIDGILFIEHKLHVFFDRKRIGFSGFASLLLEERDILAVELLERLVLSLLAETFAVTGLAGTDTVAPMAPKPPMLDV